MVINSTYQADPPDELGRYQVVERHYDADGREVTMVVYTCEPGWNPDEIMAERAIKINDELLRRAQQTAEANNFAIPWSHRDFWQRVSADEYVACKILTETDAIAAYWWGLIHTDGPIYPGNALLVQGLGYFEAMGKLAPGRANEIAGVE